MTRLRTPRELASALRRQSIFTKTRQWRNVLIDAANILDNVADKQEEDNVFDNLVEEDKRGDAQ